MIGVLRGERFGQANDKILGVEAHYDTVDGSPGTISPLQCYSHTCVKRPYTTKHILGFSDRRSLIAA